MADETIVSRVYTSEPPQAQIKATTGTAQTTDRRYISFVPRHAFVRN
jgi:hypothetical protein